MADLNYPTLADELLELWLEYEEGSSPAGKIAKQLDKFEMIVQADEYEKLHPGIRLQSFFDSTAGYFTHPQVNF